MLVINMLVINMLVINMFIIIYIHHKQQNNKDKALFIIINTSNKSNNNLLLGRGLSYSTVYAGVGTVGWGGVGGVYRPHVVVVIELQFSGTVDDGERERV